MDNLKQKTLSGFVYKFLERGSAQGISFIVQIILARILMPDDFGTVALLTVFMTILDVFVTYGFGNSLVVNKKSDELDFSTCFFFGIGLSFFIYWIVFLTSPYISSFFYDRDDLDILIKIMALRLPIAAINSVQHAHVAKSMNFKLFFYATSIGTILSGIIGIFMAYDGYGVWALVVQYLSNSFFNTLFLWLFAKWRPKWMFSFQRLKIIYDYGWKILVVGLIDTIYGQIRSLVIAKQYSRSDLAYYNRGSSFPGFGMKLIEPTINGVLFPSLSSCNDDSVMMKSVTRRVTKISTYLICGIMAILFGISKPMVLVLLTEKWLPCVVFIQIYSIGYLFRPLQIINNCVIRASGRSAILLKLDLLKKGIGVLLLLISMRYGVVAIAWSLVFTNLISTFINIFPNRNLLSYGYREQFWDLANNLFVPFVVGGIVWSMSLLPISSVVLLGLQLIVGISSFVIISKAFRIESFQYLTILVRQKSKSKKSRNETI